MVIRFESEVFCMFLDEKDKKDLSIILTPGALIFSCKELIFLADHVQVLISQVRLAVLPTGKSWALAQVPNCSALKSKFT